MNVYTNSFTFSPAGDLLTLKDGKNQQTSWKYDRYGRMTNKTDAASNEILRYQYDAASRLTNRWSATKGNTVYKYDAVNSLTNVDYPSSLDLTYKYDALNRLCQCQCQCQSSLFKQFELTIARIKTTWVFGADKLPFLSPLARKLRVQYGSAIYHFMNRGDRCEAIFLPTPSLATDHPTRRIGLWISRRW